jgi:hypothetical protein
MSISNLFIPNGYNLYCTSIKTRLYLDGWIHGNIVSHNYSGYKYISNEIGEHIKVKLKITTDVNGKFVNVYLIESIVFSLEHICKKIIMCGGIETEQKNCKNLIIQDDDKACRHVGDYKLNYNGIMTTNIIGLNRNNDYVPLVAIYTKNTIEIVQYCGDLLNEIIEILPFCISLPTDC